MAYLNEHGLETFKGKLDIDKAKAASLAPIFSTATTYASGARVVKDGVLYEFTANHAAGAWTGSDAKTVQVGPELSDLNNQIKYQLNTANAFNLLDCSKLNNRTHRTVTFTWNADHTNVTVNGTASGGVASQGLFDNQTGFPDGIIPGGSYTLVYNAINVYFEFRYYTSGSGSNTTNLFTSNKTKTFTVPLTATGAYIRLTVNSGTKANNEVINTPSITPSWMKTNAELSELLEVSLKNKGVVSSYSYSDCDDVIDDGIYFVSTSGGVPAITNFPLSNPGWLQTIKTNSSIILQVVYPYNNADNIMYRSKQGSSWSAWKSYPVTETITQEVNRDTYNNTYNLTVSPSITTDDNGWLQSVDSDTSSETGKTDMTSAIMAMLNSTGYCHLSPGIFYVSGNIDMPEGSILEGCGKQTIIRLLQTTTSGYIVRMHTKSTIRNLCLSGSYSQGSISDGSIGGRKGINFIGNRDGNDSGVTPTTCRYCIVDGCYIENLDSGIYCYNAGGGINEGLNITNCYFSRCKAGINIDYWTEYCKVSNCVTFQCYYGCINNGGNNAFVNCSFHGVIGFLIDNSGNDKPNIAHGSVVACTFNHIDNMNNPGELGQGLGIKILGSVPNGFLFSNCQMWYSRVHIENAEGIQISGCEIGGLGGVSYPFIEAIGTGMLFVDNCLFKTAPNLSISSPAKFTNCWTYSGTAVTA